VVDGALSHALEAAGQPARRWPDRHPLQGLRDVARAALLVLELEVELLLPARATSGILALGSRQTRSGPFGPAPAQRRPHLAAEPDDSEGVGTVEGNLDLEHRLGGTDHVVEGLPDRGLGAAVEIGGEIQDALVIVAELELARRAQHALALLAADRALLDHRAPGQRGPHGGE